LPLCPQAERRARLQARKRHRRGDGRLPAGSALRRAGRRTRPPEGRAGAAVTGTQGRLTRGSGPGMSRPLPPENAAMQHTLPFLGTLPAVPVVRLTLVREGGASYVGEPIRSSGDAAALLTPHHQDASREVVLALLLDIRHRPVGLHVVSIGSVNSSMLP